MTQPTKIKVEDYIETKEVVSMGKRYIFKTNVNAKTPVHVKIIKKCAKHNVEHLVLAKCPECEKEDPIVKLCIAQAGMTPSEYQAKFKRAWNE